MAGFVGVYRKSQRENYKVDVPANTHFDVAPKAGGALTYGEVGIIHAHVSDAREALKKAAEIAARGSTHPRERERLRGALEAATLAARDVTVAANEEVRVLIKDLDRLK